jgi:hypothetical protein
MWIVFAQRQVVQWLHHVAHLIRVDPQRIVERQGARSRLQRLLVQRSSAAPAVLIELPRFAVGQVLCLRGLAILAHWRERAAPAVGSLAPWH